MAKHKGGKASVKPVAFAAFVKNCCVSEVFTPHTGEPDVWETNAPFIREGSVSLVGSDVKVPVTILRDTGAFGSFILCLLLCLAFVKGDLYW